MDTERGSFIRRDSEIPRKEVHLRVIPSELKFLDTSAGKVYRLPFTVHNLGRWNQKIRFQEPLKPQFKLLLNSLDKELASGLQMTAMVEYHPDKDEDTFDQLLISAGSKTIEIPLVGLIPCCQLEIESEVDFGTLVANSKVYCKEISIVNHGKAPGIFTTEYCGGLPILIFPTSGIVDAKSSMTIKVDFCADQPRIVNDTAKVSLQGRPDVLLTIKVHVVEQIIELLNMTGDKKLKCIRFGSVFFGTSKIERALIHNKSPEPINWVAIVQDDSVGEELGTNIQQRTDVALNNLTYLSKIRDIDVTSFISCVPNEGTLSPYQKTAITFCFSPKLIYDSKKDVDPSHRQDYALFLRFESVGSKDGFLRDDDNTINKNDRFQKVELALTGSGLPVALQFDPGMVLNFAPCVMGEHSEVLCIMQNRTKSLPVIYHFRKTAHFKIDPERGKINEGCMQIVMCSFIPRQVGTFKVKQVIEIIGLVADENLQSLSMKPFHHIHLDFNSVCKPFTKEVVMKINPGISPLVSNPTGQFVVKDFAKCKDYAPVAMLQSAKARIHSHEASKDTVKDALIAFPNDRAASIRPGEQGKHFRTIFTKIPRYNYVDPDFAYTKIEELEKRVHQNYYEKYIKCLRSVRLQKQAERESRYSYDELNIGLQPGSGLKSPSLSESDIEDETSSAECQIKNDKMLCTRNIASKEAESLKKKVLKGLKSEPSTPQEKQDCSLILTSKQIHQVIVGPSVLNFGDVCVNSTNTHPLHVINMLPMHILIQLDIDLEELQKTKQLSYVIPPTTSTYISMIFESPTIGKFWKSFTFTVNNTPGGHILVMAVVQLAKLELSSNEIVLRPHGFAMKACFRGTVRLYNRQNYFAQFKWLPVRKERRMVFSIRPSKGVVEAYSSLECEVTWQPGFSSPERGEFILQVYKGNALTLKCVAHIGHTKVILLESRILFSNSPQGLTSWRKAVLRNVGQNHAFFKVCDQNLLPIINIVPSEGIVPLGGLTVLNIGCTPTVAEKFDTKAKVAIRHANILDLRIGGSIEVADVEVSPNVFHFCGTYVGSTEVIPFVIKNRGITRARVEFDLEEYEDFAMDLKDKASEFANPEFPFIYSFEVEENTSLECGLAFSPKEVATLNFTFQVRVNFMGASEDYRKAHLSSSTPSPKTGPLISTCYIQATVLQAPLKLSSTEFVFEVPLHNLEQNKKVTRVQELLFHNISKRHIQWTLDISDTGRLFTNGTFKFSAQTGHLQPKEKYSISIFFCPNNPGKYAVNIPVLLNDNPLCYQMLHLTGEVKSPKLLFDPPFIFFTPVPLGVTTTMDITITPQNYFRASMLSIQIATEIPLDDDKIFPLSVKFPNGKSITGSGCGVNPRLISQLSFKSSKPMSFLTNVVFCDDQSNRFSLPVSATAENCILTIYPYMAIHLHNRKIVLKNEMEISYENMILDENETSKKQDDTPVEKEEQNTQFFPPEDGTKACDFFQKVVNATQTWFSLFGWPEGPHCLSIPETIRRDVCKIQLYPSNSSSKKFCRQNDFSKYNKTIYDVLLHLSGKMPPGINLSQSLPVDDTARLKQLHLQHSSVLTFLNNQGACIAHVLPEFLFEPEDYTKWIEITSSSDTMPASSCTPEDKNPLIIDMDEFEALSTRAWTDVLLQTYKVLVLSRVAPYCGNNVPPLRVQNTPKINPSFASSNIYSTSERILLSWMNTNYENTRHIIWKNCRMGVTPPERWIINFDKDLSDGLVFATQVAAYCPFLIDSYFANMYTQPKSPEQYLHNCLIVVNAFHEIGFYTDIQATDIFDPNPILMLMLCVYMYERLPTYLPKKVVPFNCTLHDTVLREILLKNSSVKNLVYNATIVGRDAADFSLSQTGNVVTISPKNQINVTVKFISRFLHPAEASLLLISKPKNTVGGATMTFALRAEVRNFQAMDVIKCKTPCYQWKEITVKVKSHFQTAGEFNIILVESSTFVTSPSQLNESGQLTSHMNHGDTVSSSEYKTPGTYSHYQNAFKTSIRSSFIKEFFCSTRTIYLGVKGSSSLEIFFLPFDMQTRYCVIILSNPKIGELIYMVEGKGLMPLPSKFIPLNYSPPLDYNTSPDEEFYKEDPVLYLNCNLQQVLDLELKLPLTNEAKEKALAFAAQQQISDLEYERRFITGTLESSSIRVAIAILGLTMVESCKLFNISKLKKPKSVVYETEASLPQHFLIPQKICIPQVPESQDKSKRIKPASKKALDEYVPFPLRFVPLSPGRYPCKILLTSRYDVRVYCIEGVVNEENAEAKLQFETPAFKAITQNIPISNKTKNEWRCQVTIEGEWFYGPSVLYIAPGETAQYPLTFKPILECEVTGKLTLQNEADGVKHVFDIKGIGRTPLAFENVVVNCQVGDMVNRPIMVPNYTKTIVTYKVTSDLPIVWGSPDITIDADSVVPYVLHISPWKRGIFKGAVSFSVKSRQDNDFQEETDREQSIQKSSSEISQNFDEEDSDGGVNSVKVWYSLEIRSSPAPPVKIIIMNCVALCYFSA
ncbi:cilia- and flagella-associated protein 47 isoform X2 [Elephas maximus indicus]|uniref:cilia- and flagella-associated protein 47 isoform X2 n=1 Tax=Elephas maximus indicus TaxID=99487 RepID=UPI002115E008|nr:cilia- and flagella-associated protein 47 isoform X2 [Elephas maximus indicus]